MLVKDAILTNIGLFAEINRESLIITFIRVAIFPQRSWIFLVSVFRCSLFLTCLSFASPKKRRSEKSNVPEFIFYQAPSRFHAESEIKNNGFVTRIQFLKGVCWIDLCSIDVFGEKVSWYETPLRDGFHSNNAWKQDEAW